MRLCTNGRVAVYCFSVALTVTLLPLLATLHEVLVNLVIDYWVPLFLAYSVLIQGVLNGVYRKRGHVYKVAWRAGLLGQGFGFGIILSFLSPPSWRPFGWYFSLLSLFHFSEYLVTAVIKPKALSLDSFLLSHSKEYGMAAVASWLEFALERYLFPDMKLFSWISICGVCLCIVGELIRKLAMFTAGSNFNHIVQSNREEGHVLVTHGIYSLWRHPSYVGWFYWSIGTQLILVNPICTVGYALASWSFFKHRIDEEEITLLNFFGEDYVTYQRKVNVGLPFIKGYRVEL